MNLGCMIMAAGSSSRFGANKLLQDFHGKPLCQWAMEAVPAALFSDLIVVTGYEPVMELSRSMGFRVVGNHAPELGISRTIRLGLETMLHCDGVLFMTADQPLLTTHTIRRLVSSFQSCPHAIHAVSHNGQRGNPCLFPQSLFAQLLKLEGDTGGAKVIKSHPELLQLLEVPEAELVDCDTAQTLNALASLVNA